MRTWVRLMAFAAISASFALSARAADELPAPVYAVKQQVATTGSIIRKNVVTSSKVPVNRRYAELTPNEQQIVKSAYEAMRPLDEPPYPIDGLKPVSKRCERCGASCWPKANCRCLSRSIRRDRRLPSA